MQLTQIFSPQVLVWLAMTLYSLSFLPQIIENYKIKSGTGLSDYFLLAYLNTYITLIYYIFCLNLPIAYKIACPLQFIATLILIGQRLYYNHSSNSSLFGLIYLANLIGSLIFIPIAIMSPNYTGHIFGWISFILILLNQMPQVLKVFSTKSVAGFSYMFILIMAVAAAIETYTALALGLPMQTLLSAARGLIYFVIFSVLFLMYKK
ncbi:MAG: PQ-loop domain-containing transporter [bacterium]